MYTVTVPAQHTVTYTRDEMCGAPATTVGFRDPGIFHTAVFSGLSPNQRVYYRFGDGAEGVWSAEYSFLTPPEAGGDVNMIAFGDLGQAPVDDTIEEVSVSAVAMAVFTMSRTLCIPVSTRPRPLLLIWTECS